MELTIKGAGTFMKHLGCEGIRYQRSSDQNAARFTATRSGTQLAFFVQTKEEWGQDIETGAGTNWSDDKYPFACVQFLLPTPDTHFGDNTHFVLVSKDGERLILTTSSIISEANKGWITDSSGRHAMTALVPCWEPKLFFFKRHGDKWEKDGANIWTKPSEVSMDPDEFLASLR